MTLSSHFALNTVFRVKSFSMDAPILRPDCFKVDGDAHKTVSGNDSPWSVVSGDIRLMLIFESSGSAVEVVSNESAIVENGSFLLRSLDLPYEVPQWLYILKCTRLRAVSRRQNGSCLTSIVIAAVCAASSMGPAKPLIKKRSKPIHRHRQAD